MKTIVVGSAEFVGKQVIPAAENIKNVFETILGQATKIPSQIAAVTQEVKSLGWEARITFREKRTMAGEQEGMVGNEDEYESISNNENHIKLSFYLSDEQAESALYRINNVTSSCYADPSEKCIYHLTSRNCVDFIREVFNEAGFKHDVMEFLTDEQLGYGHLSNLSPTELFANKAINYGYATSRGVKHYITSNIPDVVTNIASSVLDYFDNIRSIVLFQIIMLLRIN
ncbi:MAG: hypothetical protein ACK4OM_06165 [Alphaproteobacteria bacterium]